ncbi:MAG: bifunctional 4-hydroxy-2-oxoglutarate aldolase/2-dehydro-3-deoxy-phosphogluconate aldolase [Myxococcota bacterium]
MSDTVERIRSEGLIAVVDADADEQLFDWAIAVAKGGVKLLGIPVWLPNVTEITSDLADEAGLEVGIFGVVSTEQVSLALAAGASFILSPLCNEALIQAASERGVAVIAGGSTPTEVARAAASGADLVSVFPAGALGGPDYLAMLHKQLSHVDLLAAGGVDVENAPTYLEAGATAAILDRGLFPESSEPAALEVITARAKALTEVCSEVIGREGSRPLVDIFA